jgi:hypothetical protein
MVLVLLTSVHGQYRHIKGAASQIEDDNIAVVSAGASLTLCSNNTSQANKTTHHQLLEPEMSMIDLTSKM